MQDQINQLKTQVQELQTQLEAIKKCTDYVFVGNLDDAIVERTFNSNITGTPPVGTAPYADNTLLYQVALSGAAQDIKVMNFPARVLIYKWKGQRLAIPVYDATTMIYP